MLPAEDKSRSIGQIVKALFPHPKVEIGELFISDMNVSESQEEPQHLYFVSDDEIKEGEHFYATNLMLGQGIFKCGGSSTPGRTHNEQGHVVSKNNFFPDAKKVIATTDKSLRNDIPTLNTMGERTVYPKLLPQIPQSFVKSYVKNPVDEVEIVAEYVPGKVLEGLSSPSKQCKLTLNENNEAIISAPNQKTYQEENLKDILHDIVHDAVCSPTRRIKQPNSNNVADFVIKWIDKNL